MKARFILPTLSDSFFTDRGTAGVGVNVESNGIPLEYPRIISLVQDGPASRSRPQQPRRATARGPLTRPRQGRRAAPRRPDNVHRRRQLCRLDDPTSKGGAAPSYPPTLQASQAQPYPPNPRRAGRRRSWARPAPPSASPHGARPHRPPPPAPP